MKVLSGICIIDGEGTAAWKKFSCIFVSASASVFGSGAEPSEIVGLCNDPGSGGLGCDIESMSLNQFIT